MVSSALPRHGISYLTTLEQELIAWLDSHEYESISQLQGFMSQLNCPDPSRLNAHSTFAPLQDHADRPRGKRSESDGREVS